MGQPTRDAHFPAGFCSFFIIGRGEPRLSDLSADIDLAGETGVPIISKRSIFEAGSTDPGDSYIAAQVVAAHSLAQGMAGGDARLAVVAFSGSFDATFNEMIRLSQRGEALPRKADIISSNLTNDAESLNSTLADILDAGVWGFTDFSAGMNASIDTLTADSDTGSSPGHRREKLRSRHVRSVDVLSTNHPVRGSTPVSRPTAQSTWNWVRQAERDQGVRKDGLTTEEKEDMIASVRGSS